ncbi:toprim domain-containing protein [Gemmata sp. G18]|uniref:Toprim domain-containing protein n=1 Tax=Gemmata palustris TaxID=2822762 RepID=A0ABS5BMU7_9BACT|nr:toprim domain-containing protein [Gemmata palustris]MBP3955036.1 toprim domain-containing protein [Gemmata palustris]
MTHESQWRRVSRDEPCPVCSKFDWCLIAEDKSAAICPRTESPKRCGGAGFLHRLTDAPRAREPRRVVFPRRAVPPDLTALATRYREAAGVERLTAIAAQLGVSGASLTAFGVGWAENYPAWTFPMTNPETGTVTGIRLRPLSGRKFSVTGGKEALFLPDSMAPDEVLLVCEGETDALAAHTLGFGNAVGRPSCTGGTTALVALVCDLEPARVVIARDNDEPGTRGADALAMTLALYARDVRVIAPPDGVKDVREWVASGATRDDLEQHARATGPRRLNPHLRAKGTT